ncbi:CvpA family protein [Alkalibacter rhizosphaerae]|uniref:CvpA family protein n=1 Tax=Alkalibacter rhizosphaerae TaxID=2815577 RepID=A0A975AHF6_9FIRM|nr:CvpA family protein [Alkalibacter rhizosphaerae]QSX07569.1 CvpA family protein [Alkalibacter rhizosphaerae]
MSWVDILILFIFGFYIVLDFNRGLVQSLASVVSFIVSLIVATVLYKSVYAFIVENTGYYDKLVQFLQERFATDGSTNGISILDLEKLPEAVRKVIEGLITDSASSGVGVDMAASLADMILYALCFLGVFIVVRIIIFVIAGLLDFIAKLPGLNIVNKLGGVAVGVIEGALISLVIVNGVYTLSILFKMESVINALNNSSIAQYFYIGYFFI